MPKAPVETADPRKDHLHNHMLLAAANMADLQLQLDSFKATISVYYAPREEYKKDMEVWTKEVDRVRYLLLELTRKIEEERSECKSPP